MDALTPTQAASILALIRAAKKVCPRAPPKVTPSMKDDEIEAKVHAWYASFVTTTVALERLGDDLHKIDADTIDKISRYLAP